MAHFVGDINFSRFIGLRISDVDYEDGQKKCIVIPIQDNDIVNYRGEWKFFFRAFRYHEPRGRYTHFLMKSIPLKRIKNLSQRQIEEFSMHHIGGMYKQRYEAEAAYDSEIQPTHSSEDFIKNNI